MTKPMRYVLALDSAVNGCGVCIYDTQQSKVIHSVMMPMLRGQAEALVPLVKDVIQKSELSFSDIDLIATTIGPGTFTGLRVGISAAKSFSLSLNKPVAGFTSLEALAYEFSKARKDQKSICVLIESKRQDFYMQLFDCKGRDISEPMALSTQSVLEKLNGDYFYIIGDGSLRFLSEASDDLSNVEYVDGYDQPNPEILAELASQNVSLNDLGNIQPLYLRGADVSQPKIKPRMLEKAE